MYCPSISGSVDLAVNIKMVGILIQPRPLQFDRLAAAALQMHPSRDRRMRLCIHHLDLQLTIRMRGRARARRIRQTHARREDLQRQRLAKS